MATHPHPTKSIAPGAALLDIFIVIAVSVGAFLAEDWARVAGHITLDEGSRGFIAVLAGAAAALLLALLRGQSFSDLGFRHPKRWWTVPFWVIAILVAFIGGQIFLPVLVFTFIEMPAPDLSRHNAVAGNLQAAIAMALILPFTASIPEEIIYRGFLMDRLGHIFGFGLMGAVLTVIVQGMIFGSIHFQWGIGGMIVTSLMGMIWGTAYLLCGRNLWIMILAHSAGHLLMVTQLYLADPTAG